MWRTTKLSEGEVGGPELIADVALRRWLQAPVGRPELIADMARPPAMAMAAGFRSGYFAPRQQLIPVWTLRVHAQQG